MVQFDLFPEEESTEILTVSELTDRIRSYLEEGFPDVWVVGEVST